jgi:mannosyl-3-phosphoglycerate phosphatase family protein
MPSSHRPLLVFSDMDGCLLDHFSYSYAAAKPALEKLKELTVPLILTSSKTIAELAALSAELDLGAPYIVENGAGVIIPDGYFTVMPGGLIESGGQWLKSFGPGRTEIISKLQRVRAAGDFSFRGFADMSSSEVAACTGLTEQQAALARKRQFTEPILWQDSESRWQDFAQRIGEQGLYSIRGGRFIHISGGGDKGLALHWLRNCYHQEYDSEPVVMALGDSENDVGMLAEADFPVVVRSPVHAPPAVTGRDDILVTDKVGPEGWNIAVLERLQIYNDSGFNNDSGQRLDE